MKKLAILVLSVFVVASMSASVMANDVIVAFDAAGTQGEGAAALFAPFDLYIIGQGVGTLVGWELGMDYNLDVVAGATGATDNSGCGWTVLDRNVNNGPGVNPTGDDNYIIGLGACVGTGGEDYLFITYNAGLAQTFAPLPVDDTFCLVPPIDGLPPAFGVPAYVDCSNTIVEMGLGNLGCPGVPDGCAVFNPSVPCIVATEQSSWGAVKAAY